MPVRNEVEHIITSLESVFGQDYPLERMEVIVADGMSDDGTRDLIAPFLAKGVRLIDNPEGIVSTGLNRAIGEARGEVVVRVDGHCELASDFLSQSVKLLEEHPEAWCVGGPIVHEARSSFGRAAARAMSHPLGVGGATHRFEGFEGYVDSVQFPAFRRWVFDRVGMFDPALVRNQDDELSFRVTKAGGKIFASPRVRYRYFVRERPGQLFRQYFQYSFWRVPVIRKHRRPTSVRQLVPPLFFVAVAAGIIAGGATGRPLVGGLLPALYAMCLAGGSVGVARHEGWRVAARFPLAVVTMHVAYAGGWILGGLAAVARRDLWKRDGALASLSR